MAATKRVAVVMLPVRNYCRHVLRGVVSVSAQARWECILIPAVPPPPLANFAEGYIHGLIGHFSEKELVAQAAKARLPAVDISPARPQLDFPRVTTDEIAVGRLAATHLLSLGLPQFAFYGTRNEYSSLLREEGFKATVAPAGLSCHLFLEEDGPPSQRTGDQPLEQWVRELPKPVGVMASSDGRGLHLLAVCRKQEIEVPKAVAVVGVDNDDVFCELANPPLSSIALSTQRIGYEAARMLDRLMAGNKLVDKQLLVPPAGVVPRRSSDLPSLLDPDVAAAVRYIGLHVHEHLHVADVLREVPVSRRSLDQRFLKALGRTPSAEIRRAQVEIAKQMLAQTEESMASVARAAGFSNAKQLGASFHRETRATPSAYRRRFRAR
jgi:LacI family transcriptional regulator